MNSFSGITLTVVTKYVSPKPFTMKKTVILLLMMVFVGGAFAQTKYVEKGKNYSLTRIYSKKTGIIKASSFQLVNDSLTTFTRIGASSPEKLNVAGINFVSVKVGNKALPFGLYGGATGLLCSLYGVLSVKADPTLDDSNVNWAPFILGFTAGGAAIGAVIGAFSTKWARLYIPTAKAQVSLYIIPTINNKYFGTQLTFKF